jgi:hypothetical protein
MLFESLDRYYTSTVVTEWLPVGTSSANYTFHKAAEIQVPLEPGDYVQVFSHVEGTNDLGYNLMFARYLKETSTDSVSHLEGTIIAKPMGTNISHDIHHGMLEQSGDFLATESRLHRFLLVCYSASTAADPGDLCQVQYVEMRLAVWRAPSGEFLTFDETELG